MMTAKQAGGYRPAKIISGGQTGVDRAALDVAMALGIPHGGWCPRGRLAEDGTIPPQYQLAETDSPDYAVRTERNVQEADATLILCRGRPSGGTELTWLLALRHGKPVHVVDLSAPPPLARTRRWLARYARGVLNIAGPRERQSPGIGAEAAEYLQKLLQPRSSRRA